MAFGAADAVLQIKVLTDASDAAKGMDQAADSTSKFQKGLRTATKAAAVAAGGLALIGKSAFDAASEAEQASGAVDAVFGRSAKRVHNWAAAAAEGVGLAASEYSQMASVIGSQLKNMGVAQADLAPETNRLIELGADLAAQYGGSTSEAVEALSSLLRGERDPIEKYGVSIKQADIEARKAAMGLDGLTGEAAKAADRQATLALLFDQTSTAQGAFAREADTAAGAQQRASAQWKNAQAALGQALLPVVSKASRLFQGLGRWTQENAGAVQVFAAALAGLVTIVFAVNAATKAWTALQTAARLATKAWTAVQWLFNAAMAANPIVLIAAGIAALVAGLIAAYKHSDRFRKIVDAVGRVARRVFQAVVKWLQRVVKAITPVVKWIAGRLVSAFKVARTIGVAVFRVYRVQVQVVVRIITTLVRLIRLTLTAAFRIARTVGVSVWNAMRRPIQRVIDIIGRLIAWLRQALAGAFRAAHRVGATVFTAIRALIQRILNVLGRVATFLRNAFAIAMRVAHTVGARVFTAIRALVTRIFNTLSRVATFLRNGLAIAFRVARTVGAAAFTAVRALITRVFNTLSRVATFLRNAFATAFRVARSVASTAFGAVRSTVQAVYRAINSVVTIIGNALSRAWSTLRSAGAGAWNAIKRAVDPVLSVIRTIKDIVGGVFNTIKDVIGRIPGLQTVLGLLSRINKKPTGSVAPGAVRPRGTPLMAPATVAPRALFAPMSAPAPRTFTAPVARRNTTNSMGFDSPLIGAPVYITVEGALDPDAVARQIRSLLTARQRRTAGV